MQPLRQLPLGQAKNVVNSRCVRRNIVLEDYKLIPNDHSLMLFKFGEYRYNEMIKQGTLSFSCIGNFIEIAKKTGNVEQGDLDEAVFARLKRNDPRIKKCEDMLKEDLEIIEDGAYLKLRRYSSNLIPTFCFYSLRPTELLEQNDVSKGNNLLRYNIDERIFNSFANKAQGSILKSQYTYSQLIIQPAVLVCLLTKSVYLDNRKEGIVLKTKYIDYSIKENEEYYIEPTEERLELFAKESRYKYQNEARICLLNKKLGSIFERYNFKIDKLNDESAQILRSEVYLQIEAEVGVIEETN